jgi:hypothetical protein
MSEIFPTKPSTLERTERELKKIENELFKESSSVILSVVKDTFDIDPADTELPAEWMEELQECETEQEREGKMRELNRRKRIATYALQSPKNAPVALQIAAKVLGGMQKARAMEGAAPKTLNLTMVSMSAPGQPVPQFPVKEVKHE